MTDHVFLEQPNDLSKLRIASTIRSGPPTSRERACHAANCSMTKTVSAARQPVAVAYESGAWFSPRRKWWRCRQERRGRRAGRDVTRDQRRASAPTPPARSRRPPHRHHYTCAPRAFRAPPFVVATPRHFLAHVGDAAGRARALDSNAINAAVVNERRPRPGGWRPLIGRAAGDDRPPRSNGGGSLHALAAPIVPQSRMWRSPRDDTYRVRNLCSFISRCSWPFRVMIVPCIRNFLNVIFCDHVNFDRT